MFSSTVTDFRRDRYSLSLSHCYSLFHLVLKDFCNSSNICLKLFLLYKLRFVSQVNKTRVHKLLCPPLNIGTVLRLSNKVILNLILLR